MVTVRVMVWRAHKKICSFLLVCLYGFCHVFVLYTVCMNGDYVVTLSVWLGSQESGGGIPLR